MNPESREQLPRQRAEVIMKVRLGLLSARQGAKELCVSRKTYYEWEQRGLLAMMQALSDREVGRPPEARDPEKEAMSEQIEELNQRLALSREAEAIRGMLGQMPGLKEAALDPSRSSEKKRGKPHPGGPAEAP